MALYWNKDGDLCFKEEFYPGGIGFDFRVDEILVSEQSGYQRIQVFRNSFLGRVLVIDGIIQVTDFDEECYHGPVAGLSVGLHTTEPESVLIFGGGDLGALHQVLRYLIKRVDLVEIDEMVTEVCGEYLPRICKKIPSEKANDVRILFEDGCKFIREAKEAYDVVIVDSSEPIGPGKPLFGKEFYRNVFDHLRSDGIILAQAGSLLYSNQWLKTFRLLSSLSKGMDVRVFCINVPTYGGLFALVGARRDKCFPSEGQLIKMLTYGSQRETEWNCLERYRAAQVLPPNIERALREEKARLANKG